MENCEASFLEIRSLTVTYGTSEKPALDSFSLSLPPGSRHGIVGESGSGKSTLALSIMGLLSQSAKLEGTVEYGEYELTGLAEEEKNAYRWTKIALVFQNSLDVLNPVLTLADQLDEIGTARLGLSRKEARERSEYWLEACSLDRQWLGAFPHQLSGGMRQKVLIAMALIAEPEVLIVDEPTMALDPRAKREIASLLLSLQRSRGFSLIVISHEMKLIQALCDSVTVLYEGLSAERGSAADLFTDPRHPYTKGLLGASWELAPYRDLWGIPAEDAPSPGIPSSEGCPFFRRCFQALPECGLRKPVLETITPCGVDSRAGCGSCPADRSVACLRGGIVTLLEARGLTKSYTARGAVIRACRGVSLSLRKGEIIALVGKSGSGKTTLASLLAGLLSPDSGSVSFEGRPLEGYRETSRPGGIQMVFQDPFSATNELLSIKEILAEPLRLSRSFSRGEIELRIRESLLRVGLPSTDAFLSRSGHTLSGGQRQRVALARALGMRPSLLVADEISAMLDPSSAANVLRELKSMQNAYGFSMLYITHDHALARKIADRVLVMHHGYLEDKPCFSSERNKGRGRKLRRGAKVPPPSRGV